MNTNPSYKRRYELVLYRWCVLRAIALVWMLLGLDVSTSTYAYAQPAESAYARGYDRGKTEAEQAYQELSHVKDEDHRKLIKNRYRRSFRNATTENAKLSRLFAKSPDEVLEERLDYWKGVEAGLRTRRID